MAISERSRHEMFVALQEVLGEEAAMTLTEHLPPGGAANVATKDDISRLREDVDLRFDRLQIEMDQRFDKVDQRFAEMDQRFAEMDQRFAEIDQRFAEINQRFAGVDQQFEGINLQFENWGLRLLSLVDQRFERQTRTIVFAFITSLIGFGGMMLAAVAITR